MRYELVTVQQLTRAEHDDIRERYLRVLSENHPPMPELLTELVEDFQRRQALLTAGVRTGVPSPQLADAIHKQARISAFAATNAVYSFQEHSLAVARRIGGESLAARVNEEFAGVYARRWNYLLAYKLRKAFTHVSLAAIGFTTGRHEEEASATLEIRLDCSSIMSHVGPQVRDALGSRGVDPMLSEVLDAAVTGVREVHARIRPILYREAAEDIAALSTWRHHFLEPGAAVSLTSFPEDLGHGSRLSYTFIDPDELLAAGMSPY